MENEYDKILTDSAVPVNEYDALLEDDNQLDKAQIRNNFQNATKTTPESAAETAGLAERSGLPHDVVERNKDEVKARDAADANDYDALIKAAPITSEYFKDYAFTKVAREDIDRLPFWEQITQGFKDIPAKFQQGRDTNRIGEIGYREIMGTATEEEIKEADKLEARGAHLDEVEKGHFYAALTETANLTGQFIEPGQKAVTYGLGAALVTGGSAAYASSVFPPAATVTVPAATIGGFGVGSTYYMMQHAYKVEAGHAYREFRSITDESGNRLDPVAAKAGAVIVGTINSALEIGGMGAVGKAAGVEKISSLWVRQQVKALFRKPTFRKAFTEFAKRYATAWGGETGTEVIQEGVNFLVGEMLKSQANKAGEGNFRMATFEEFMDRMSGIAYKVGMGMFIPAGGASTFNLAIDARKAQKARQMENVFNAIAENAESTKLRDLVPAKFREFVDTATKDGPVEDIYIGKQEFDEYFQSAGINPEEAAQELGIRDQYLEQTALSGDLLIKTSDWATKIAGTDHHGALMRHARFNADDFSIAQSDKFEKEYEAELKKQTEIVSEHIDQISRSEEPLDQIFNQIRGGLSRAGMAPDAADKQATMYRAFFKVMSERSGKSPQDLFNQWKLKVQREFPKNLQIDTTDLLIDAVRNRKTILPRQIYGPSLGEFLVEKGGLLDEGGELSARDLQLDRIGRRRLVKETGMSLDAALEAVREAGYEISGDIEGHDALLAALESEAVGEPIYAARNINQKLADQEAAMDDLSGYLESIGMDLESATNQEIKKALMEGVEAAKIDMEKYRTIYDQDVPRGTPLDQIEVEIDAIDPKTGNTMKITERADVALRDVNDSISELKELIKCLKS